MTSSPLRRITDAVRHRFRSGVLAFALAAALIFSAPSARATLNNGEPAIDILGEFNSPSSDTTADYVKGCINNGASALGFNTQVSNDFPDGVIDATNHRLFVSDQSNSRVLVFTLNGSNQISSKTAANVLGQQDFISCQANQGGTVGQSTMNNPAGLDFDAANNRLFVADYANHRVLVFNTSSITNGMNASYVLGQANFTSNGNATTQSGMYYPQDVKYDSANNRVFVSDYGNNRMTVWNVAPGSIANGENASYVLGQANFTTGSSGLTQTKMKGPVGLTYDSADTLLSVAEFGNNRVTLWNVAPGTIANGENASYVLGQADFTHGTAHTTQAGMSGPQGVSYDSANNRLFVGDFYNNRALVFPTSNIINDENATDILGQFNSVSSDATPVYTKACTNNGASQIGFDDPSAAAIDTVNHRLFVAEANNNRVLVFTLNSSNQISSKTPANVIGQTDFITCTVTATTASTLNGPVALAFDGTNNRLFVGDYDDNRVLVFNTSSISNGMSASYALGEPDMVTVSNSCTQSLEEGIRGLAYDDPNNRLFVADEDCNRVMVYNVAPGSIATGENASYVLGQTNFTNNGHSTTQSTLYNPNKLALDSANNRLFVADQTNNRVMVFNVAPGSIANGENAANVLGEPDFVTAAGQGGQVGFNYPQGVAYDSANSRLFVADTDNDRVMVFNVATGTIANGENATSEIGQPDFVTDNFLNPNQSQVWGPTGVTYDSANSQIYVTEGENNRVTLFNTAATTITNGANATDILGQFTSPSSDATPSYTKSCVNDGASPIGFKFNTGGATQPGGIIDSTNHRLFVADSGNNRVLVFTLNSSNQISSKTAANVLGQTDFISCQANQGGGTGQSTLSNPAGMDFDAANNRLFVADQGNNRILVFSTSSISNGMNASYVLGQANFTGNGAATTQSTLNQPLDAKYDSANARLFVVDWTNNRVLVFNVATGTIANGENASNVLGQNSYTTKTAHTTQPGLKAPAAAAYDSTNTLLYVADGGNNRVVDYNVATGTIANNENASNVLGQANFTTGTAHTTQAGMNGPTSLAFDSANSRLFVGEFGNNRVTVFSTASLTNNENASNVLGQPNFTTAGGNTTQSGISGTDGIIYDSTNNQLYVVEEFNNRVTLFSTSSITNGENASDLLGQYNSPGSTATVVYTQNGYNNGPSALGLNANGNTAIDTVHHRLFAADYGNNRVLVYNLNSDNSFPDHTADYVLGQSSLQGGNAAATTQSGMSGPVGVAYDSGNDRLFVTDAGNNRVLVFNTSSISNGMNASNVLGQANFTSNAANDTQATMSNPGDVAYDSVNNRLFVSEYGNSRVLVFSTSSISDGMNASYVLGQANFTSNGTATTQAGMNQANGLAFDSANQRLFVAEFGNNRVLVFNVAPGSIANGENASYVLGQANFTSGGANTTQAGMTQPGGMAYDAADTFLYVPDSGNNRVLVFNVATGTIANGENASNVLGQTGYTTNTANTTQSGLYNPTSVCYDSSLSRIFVHDTSNNRVMIFSTAFTTFPNGENASDMLGQYNSLTSTSTVVYTKNGNNNGPTALGFREPSDALVDSVHHRLFVADAWNHRVLVYSLNSDNSFPDHTADYVLGQANFISRTIATTQSGMNQPNAIDYDSANDRLFVADTINCRVLVFNTSSISNGMNASYVLGEPDFTSQNCGHTQSGIALDPALAYDSANQRLFVDDYGSNRVLVFNVAPGSIANGENASYVLGQSNFTNHNSGHSQSTMNGPQGVCYDSNNSRLFVSEQNPNNRVTVWNVATGTIANGENASNVLGQTNFTNTNNNGGLTQSTFYQPKGCSYDTVDDRLYVTDTYNNRVLEFAAAPALISNGMNASLVLGQPNFTTNGNNVTQAGMGLDVSGNANSMARYDPSSNRLFVTDTYNNRVMIYPTNNAGRIVNNESAQYVLGQANFTTGTANGGGTTGQAVLSGPVGLFYDSTNTQEYVVDQNNNRIMIFNAAPSSIASGENATDELGQYTTPAGATDLWTASGPNNGPTALGTYNPEHVALDKVNHYLYVADTSNNRVLVYVLNPDNSFISGSGGHTASYVLGQANLDGASNCNLTQSGLCGPSNLAYDSANQRLFVSDQGNNRVIVYSTSGGVSSGMNASYVLGQPNYTSNAGTCSSTSLSWGVNGLALDTVNQRLFVANDACQMVLVYNVAPGTIANGESASDGLGCSTWSSTPGCAGGCTQSAFTYPGGMAYDSANNRLFVTDFGNSRVLVFNVGTGYTSNGENASYVLGQANFTSCSNATTQSGMYKPNGVAYDPNHSLLFVTDQDNDRVLMFNAGPSQISNGMNASYVIGQANFTSATAATSQSGLNMLNANWPYATGYPFYDPGSSRLFIGDAYNNRVMIFDGSYIGGGGFPGQFTPGYE